TANFLSSPTRSCRASRKTRGRRRETGRPTCQTVADGIRSWRLGLLGIGLSDERQRVRRQILVRWNVQVTRAAFRNLAEHRTADLAAVITFLRLVHHDRNAQLRIV